MRSVAPALGPRTLLVPMQNGLAADDLAAEAVGPSRVVGCVAAFDAQTPRPGVHVVGRVGGLVVGRAFGETPPEAVEKVRSLLSNALPTSTTARLREARWMKLLVNLSNALPAATGRSIQDLYADPRVARFAHAALREGVAVARAEGVRPVSIPWASARLVSLVATLPRPLGARLLARRVRAVLGERPAFASTHASVVRGQPTEVEFLNGEIVRRGAARGVPTPRNARLVAAVRAVEAGGGFQNPADLVA